MRGLARPPALVIVIIVGALVVSLMVWSLWPSPRSIASKAGGDALSLGVSAGLNDVSVAELATDGAAASAPADLDDSLDPDVRNAQQQQARTQSESETEEPEPLDIAVPAVEELGDEASSAQAAEEVVEAVIDAQGQILQRGDGGVEGLELVAAGWVKGELEALALQRSHEGLTQVGEAEIVSVETTNVDLGGEPPTLTVQACLDTSTIDVLDATGESLRDLMYRPGHPVLHVYGAEFVDGRWKVVTHDIPDSSACGSAS